MPTHTKPSSTRSKRTTNNASHKPSHNEIAEAAYYISEKRGFTPGNEMQDWLEAEHTLHNHAGHAMLISLQDGKQHQLK